MNQQPPPPPIYRPPYAPWPAPPLPRRERMPEWLRFLIVLIAVAILFFVMVQIALSLHLLTCSASGPCVPFNATPTVAP